MSDVTPNVFSLNWVHVRVAPGERVVVERHRDGTVTTRGLKQETVLKTASGFVPLYVLADLPEGTET